MVSKTKISFEPTRVSLESKYGIISTQWNKSIVDLLLVNTERELINQGVNKNNIIKIEVPGAFEIPIAAMKMASSNIDVVIALGAIVRGETLHFELIANSCAKGLNEVSLELKKPIIFGVLTTDSKAQALERADPEKGNKGSELAKSAMAIIESLDTFR